MLRFSNLITICSAHSFASCNKIHMNRCGRKDETRECIIFNCFMNWTIIIIIIYEMLYVCSVASCIVTTLLLDARKGIPTSETEFHSEKARNRIQDVSRFILTATRCGLRTVDFWKIMHALKSFSNADVGLTLACQTRELRSLIANESNALWTVVAESHPAWYAHGAN